MRKCPSCGKSHRFKSTAEHCLCNAQNSEALDIIAEIAGAEKRDTENKNLAERMRQYYGKLKGEECLKANTSQL